MPRFELIEARTHHCGQMARRLRAEHRAAVERVGGDVHRMIRDSFDPSSFRRALLCDGRLIALGGVSGTLASSSGFIWLACAEEVDRYPKQLLLIVRGLLAEVMDTKRELESVVLTGDAAALRFVRHLGFTVSPTNAYGIGSQINLTARGAENGI